jgi:hypothetical protein
VTEDTNTLLLYLAYGFLALIAIASTVAIYEEFFKVSKKQQSVTHAEAAGELEHQGPPGGFVDESRPDIQGWIRPAEGLVVYGRIVGAFAFRQRDEDGVKTREVVCLRLLQATPVAIRGQEETVTAEKGTTVGLSLNHAVTGVRYYVEGRGEVWIRFVKLEKLGRRKVWKAECRCRGRKTETPWSGIVAAAPADADDSESNNIPF